MDKTTLFYVIGACWVLVGVYFAVSYLRGNRAVDRPGRKPRETSLRKD